MGVLAGAWEVTIASVAMTAQVATAIGVVLAYVYFKRTGPVLSLESGTDSRLIYIRMTNSGRQSLTVRAFGLGTYRAGSNAGVYPVQSCPGEEAPELWVELDEPMELEAGVEKIVVLKWPVDIPVCMIIEYTEPPGRREVVHAVGPNDEHLIAAVRTFSGWNACRINSEPAGTRFGLTPTH